MYPDYPQALTTYQMFNLKSEQYLLVKVKICCQADSIQERGGQAAQLLS